MTEFTLAPLLMLLIGTCLFMVAGFAVCVALMLFCDIINLGGAFEKISEIVISAVFVPILLAGRLLDLVTVHFVSAEIKHALRPAVACKETRTVTV